MASIPSSLASTHSDTSKMVTRMIGSIEERPQKESQRNGQPRQIEVMHFKRLFITLPDLGSPHLLHHEK